MTAYGFDPRFQCIESFAVRALEAFEEFVGWRPVSEIKRDHPSGRPKMDGAKDDFKAGVHF
jgi:hypothetical protein